MPASFSSWESDKNRRPRCFRPEFPWLTLKNNKELVEQSISAQEKDEIKFCNVFAGTPSIYLTFTLALSTPVALEDRKGSEGKKRLLCRRRFCFSLFLHLRFPSELSGHFPFLSSLEVRASPCERMRESCFLLCFYSPRVYRFAVRDNSALSFSFQS